ncbi:MAG: outer membrane beta-barrel protein [Crocinitomicaceae bacterium]|nr:outer membrane beta-barrel protein [Crocinitomicaceae bacterium]MBK9591285.1 outer membrane beta-barrel protein [Crocinitomicaceae bacterium]
MKFLRSLFVLIIISQTAIAQDGFNVGAKIATSFHLNTHRNKQTTIWSSESGYGFSVGLPLRFGYADDRAFVTGLDYEYIAFDNRVNNYLVSSTRFHYLHVPATLHFNLISSLFISAGTGINLVLSSKSFVPGVSVNISNSINPFQPYLSLGVGTCVERGSGLFELSAQARYHFLDIWQKDYPQHAITTSKIVSMDLVMRFYF